MSLVENLDHAYEILGLVRGATREEVVARYREHAKKYHPDLFHAEDIPEELRQQTTEKIKAINEAYRTIITGISSSSGPAIKSGSGVEIAWKFDAKYQVFGPPVIVDEVIYFCNRGPALASRDGTLFSLALSTGKENWRFRTGGEATSSVSVIDGIAYFGSTDRNIYAIEVNTPDELWRAKTQNPVKRTPVVAEGLVFSQYFVENSLSALDAKTGKPKWTFKTAGEVAYNPAIAEDTAYFSSQKGYLYSLDLKTHRLRWRTYNKNFTIFEPIISDDLVIFYLSDYSLIALDRESASERWSGMVGRMEGMFTEGITVHDGVIFAASTRYEWHEMKQVGLLMALDAASGKQLWESPTKMDLFYTPVIQDGIIYTSGIAGPVCAFDVKTGQKIWDFDFQKWTYNLAAHEGMVYVGSCDALYALKPRERASKEKPSKEPEVPKIPQKKKQLRAR